MHSVNALPLLTTPPFASTVARLSSGNYSIMSLAFLAFGVILFDVLGGALLTKSAQTRETVLPGLGLLGDAFNNLTEVALNALTIYLYR